MAKIKKVIQCTTWFGSQFAVLYESGRKVVYGFNTIVLPSTIMNFIEDDKTILERTAYVQRLDGETVRYDYYVKEQK